MFLRYKFSSSANELRSEKSTTKLIAREMVIVCFRLFIVKPNLNNRKIRENMRIIKGFITTEPNHFLIWQFPAIVPTPVPGG